jgi:Tol biopolymer transport system component
MKLFVKWTACGMIAAVALVIAMRVIGGRLAADEIAYVAFSESYRANRLYLLDAAHAINEDITTRDTVPVNVEWSPDGSTLAVIAFQPTSQAHLALQTLYGGAYNRVTSLHILISEHAAAWSPDGSMLAHIGRDATGTQGIFIRRVGENQSRRVTLPQGNAFSPSFSPDGRMAFSWSPVANAEVYTIQLDDVMLIDSHTTFPSVTKITNNPYSDVSPQWSPDGEWIAFVSDRTGNSEIYLMRPDGSDMHAVVTHPARDVSPSWSPDSRSVLFHSNRDGSIGLYVLDLTSGDIRRLATHSQPINTVWRPD